jgi:AcrR family transcriptional regulator
MARHAFATEDKEVRRRAIIAAARELFNAGDGSLPSAAAIATAAGLAKGTIYLYFETKEEIFVSVLLQAVLDAVDSIEISLKQSRGTRQAKVKAFITGYVAALESRPELLRLDGISYGILEKNVAAGKFLESRTAVFARLADTAAEIERIFSLPSGRGMKLLTRTFALTRGIWQDQARLSNVGGTSDNPSPALRPAPFVAEISEALAEYWRGALA